MVRPPKKHSMVMVSSKTIENLQWSLQNHKLHQSRQMQLALESRKEWLVPMKGIWGDEILLGRQGLKFNFVSHRFFRLSGSSKPSFVNLKTIVDHCPQNFENHRKTIGSNGWTPKKHSMVMVQLCQNHWKTIDGYGGLKKNINHSIALKNWPSLWSRPYQVKN